MKYIIANWKSNKNQASVKNFFEELSQLDLKNISVKDNKIVLAPPFNLIDFVNQEITNHNFNFSLAVQNLNQFEAGSYTGEIGIENLKGQNIDYAILGHSERREIYQESCRVVAQKVKIALKNNLSPILCLDMPYLEEQFLFLKDVNLAKIIIAYEPLESIGTGINQEPQKTKENINKIRKFFPKSSIIYGGSVKPNNISNYLAISDGVLVGGASLEAVSWFKLINS